ncbi:substrate-binding domain-containing protein [Micromonospora sp. CB01531]|uniref:substrate-binding domain-containing protein n=1 Tax=Micromonospora sp. CB01531 TaxID=1718947 RepID=UPI0009401CF3|nr:substrate-binding domain-containing protein [Micromonospora sp. CB01531]OKI64042.1 hypothetical protein A6A27_26370 [Micromonospora sp. CB01531]
MSSSRLTVREIARLAGVSVATVSRVSNGTDQVSEETRRRVLQALEEHANGETALGCWSGASGRGLHVPEDLVITGFDDIPMAALVTPLLTTVRQPVRELAAQTARLLLQLPAGDAEHPHGGPVLPTELAARDSCGCPTSTATTSTTGCRRPPGPRRCGAGRAGGGAHSEKVRP